jgi:cell division transport system ATP-binding protein
MGLKLMHLFEELNKLGTTIVIATHDTTLLARFRHPRLVLTEGRLKTMPPAPPPRAPVVQRTAPVAPRAEDTRGEGRS